MESNPSNNEAENSKEQGRSDSQSDPEEVNDVAPIILLEPRHLYSASILSNIYSDLFHHYYAVKDWSLDTYVIQAYHGFIAVSFGEEYLLPEIQKTYCVLDWKNFHISHGAVNRLKKKYQHLSFRVNTNLSAVLEGINAHHGSNNWVNKNYTQVVTELFQRGPIPLAHKKSIFQFLSVELWEITDTGEVLIAGEIGYRIGKIYTSLTGYSTPSKPSSGILQLVALGILLRDTGHAFWNLGHPPRASGMMKYKAEIGGREISREEFLLKWREGRDQVFSPSFPVLQSNDVKALVLAEFTQQKDARKLKKVEKV